MLIPSNEAVAWFFIGEGSATLGCSKRHEQRGVSGILGYRITPHITITNTDLDVMKALKAWFEVKKIKFNFYTRKPKPPRKLRHDIKVEKFRDVKKFLRLILPYLVGTKQVVCQLMLECLVKYGRDWSKILKTQARVVRSGTGHFSSINWNPAEERKRFLQMLRYREKILNLNRGKARYRYDFFVKLWGLKNV